MGKSSLMIRTAARLRQNGTQAVILDLTMTGLNLNVGQWYKGLLNHIGSELDLEDELDDFWREQAHLPAWERWITALVQVVLPCRPGPLVVFVDEINVVRSLPFSADEFFAGIRACYNRRMEQPIFARITFCLLGVAAPSDLI